MRKALSLVAGFALALSTPVAASDAPTGSTQGSTGGQQITDFCKADPYQDYSTVGACVSSPANYCQFLADNGRLERFGFSSVGNCISTIRRDPFPQG